MTCDVTIYQLVNEGLADIQTGPFGTQLKASDYVSEGVPVINVRNIGYSDLRPDKLEYITEQTSTRLSDHVIQAGDIVFGRKGAVDRHLFVQSEQSGWLQGSDCIRLRILDTRINSRYLSYRFLLPDHKSWMLTQCGNKATMPSLNQDVVGRISIPLIPRLKQDRIVDILSAYDDLIQNNRRRIALLEQAARELYREWFVRLRFPGHEHVKVVDGVPEGWLKTTLGELLTLQRGFDLPTQNRRDGEFPILASTGITGFHETWKVKGPGVVTGRSGSLGSVIFVHDNFWPLNTALWIKEFKSVAPEFAYHLLSTLNLEQYNGGAAVPTLNRNDAHRIEVIRPLENLMIEFNETAKKSLDQIRVLTKQSALLAEARDLLLLPRLMNGSIAV